MVLMGTNVKRLGAKRLGYKGIDQEILKGK
jgi:hypothetical protein